jgi:precorrin-6Y C5,15-methyltransferase (decarboxylating)
MSSRDAAPATPTGKWLSVVGIGEDGLEGLSVRAKDLIAEAAVVFGGRRHLDLAASLIRGEAHSWPTPFDGAIGDVLSRRGEAVCVLASGDPMNFGFGAKLASHVGIAEMTIVPTPTAFSLAAARLAWPLQAVSTVSLHGRPIDLIRPLLHPGRQIIALTSDGAAPVAISRLLTEAGFGQSRVHVLEALGGPRERIQVRFAAGMGDAAFDPLNVVAIEVEAAPEARILPFGFGLDDALFEHDGQLTKREVRAVTLSALAPRHGETLWDIGAGSGSIGIEWMLAHSSLRAVAVEANAERAARIRRNAGSFGVPALRVVEGAAPSALAELPRPDAIFVGGGASDEGVVDAATNALTRGGRLVINAVTLETEALMLSLQARLGGGLVRIGIAHAAPVGSMTGWRPAMPVTQWSWVKR